MAMCVMAVVAAAPCQCFSPGGIQITSPGRISSIGPPQRCARPQPAVTISVWPSGCVCHAVRAPGSNVTRPPDVRDGGLALKSGSIRTEPVKFSVGPRREDCESLLVMVMACEDSLEADARRDTNKTAATNSFIAVPLTSLCAQHD